MTEEWLAASWPAVGWVVLSITLLYFAVVLLTRLAGLRSFATMSAFDFAMTVAIGTLIGSTAVSPRPPVAAAAVALTTLYLLKMGVAVLRRRFRWAESLVDNRPLLLVREGRVLESNLRRARLNDDDLRSKLRQANVASLARVRLAVLETTGSVSVVHGDPDQPLDPWLLEGVAE